MREEMILDDGSFGDLQMSYTFSGNGYLKFRVPSFWTRFADQGMRLLTSFAHMFFMDAPINPLDHILPPGGNNPHLERYFEEQHGVQWTLEEPGGLTTHLPEDVTICGLSRMLAQAADRVGTKVNRDLFVRGNGKDGKDICLDLEKDAVAVPPEDVQISLDIDSLIWVTRLVQVQGHVHLAITPTVGKDAPIRKSNHVTVNILYPPTAHERVSHERDWVQNITPISVIPHTIFAKIADGKNPIVITIHFPRMLHYARNGKREAKIPFPIQRMFWDRVILPALRRNSTREAEVYRSSTVDEIFRKDGSAKQRKGSYFNARTSVVSAAEFRAIQETMVQIVRDDPQLSMYKSFFFVLDAKAIKHHTRVPLSELSPSLSPLTALRKANFGLDVDYMLNRQNGELVVDLAFSFTPKKHSSRTNAPYMPLVGLWRLDVLEASFGAGGYTMGNVHNIGTFSRYGAIQATMSRNASQVSHVLYRSTYNLQYEAIRPLDNEVYFPEDGEVYDLDDKYMPECKRRIDIFRSKDICNGTYGVRDEYRIGGLALIEVLKVLGNKVRMGSLVDG